MLLYQIEREKQSPEILDLDKSLELIKNCQAGIYVKSWYWGQDILTIDYQNNEKCKIQLYSTTENDSGTLLCEIPISEMQKFQGTESFYSEPEGNLGKYCDYVKNTP